MDTIFIDIDGTIADSIPWWLSLYNVEHLRSYQKSQLTTYNPMECLGISLQPYYQDYRGVSVVPGFLSALNTLSMHFEFVAVTAGFGKDWLVAQGWRGEIIQSKSRKYLNGYALIDDYDKNLDEFPGLRFLLKQPWNENSQIYIPLTWAEITEALLNEKNNDAPVGVFAPTG